MKKKANNNTKAHVCLVAHGPHMEHNYLFATELHNVVQCTRPHSMDTVAIRLISYDNDLKLISFCFVLLLLMLDSLAFDFNRSSSHNDGKNGEEYDLFCSPITCSSIEFWR